MIISRGGVLRDEAVLERARLALGKGRSCWRDAQIVGPSCRAVNLHLSFFDLGFDCRRCCCCCCCGR